MSDALPIDPVSAVAEAIIERLQSAFGWDRPRRALKTVELLEYAFDGKTEKAVKVRPPALYLVPLAARPAGASAELDVQWALYAVSDRATPLLRAKGDAGEMGVHGIAARAATTLADWLPPVAGASAIRFVGMENITGMTLVEQRSSVFALTFAGIVETGIEEAGGHFDDFLRFHADFDLPPRDPAAPPDATLNVTLEGASA